MGGGAAAGGEGGGEGGGGGSLTEEYLEIAKRFNERQNAARVLCDTEVELVMCC